MTRPLTLGILVLLSSTACLGAREAGPPSDRSHEATAQAAGERAGSPRLQRQLVRTAELHVAVADTQEAVEAVKAIVASAGGYVAALDARRIEGLVHFEVSVRVPYGQLDATVATIKELADSVDREVLRTEDVTDAIVDLDARLRTLRATEQELQALLSESRSRQQDVEAIMAVYRQLTEIRSEIERLQAQMETLEKQVALSTLSLRVSPSAAARTVVAEDWRPLGTVRTSLGLLVRGLQQLVDIAIALVVVVFPLAAVVGLPVWAVARLVGSRRKSATQHAAVPPKSRGE